MNNETIDTFAKAMGFAPSGKISRRSYQAIRTKVYELAERFDYSGCMQHAIFAAIRNRLGRPVTELREADVPQAWAVLAEIEPMIKRMFYVLVYAERNAIKKVFGPAGIEAVEREADEALAKLEVMDVPEMPGPSYGGNVIRFPGAA